MSAVPHKSRNVQLGWHVLTVCLQIETSHDLFTGICKGPVSSVPSVTIGGRRVPPGLIAVASRNASVTSSIPPIIPIPTLLLFLPRPRPLVRGKCSNKRSSPGRSSIKRTTTRALLPHLRAHVAELRLAPARHVVAPVVALDEVCASGAARPAVLLAEREDWRVGHVGLAFVLLASPAIWVDALLALCTCRGCTVACRACHEVAMCEETVGTLCAQEAPARWVGAVDASFDFNLGPFRLVRAEHIWS